MRGGDAAGGPRRAGLREEAGDAARLRGVRRRFASSRSRRANGEPGSTSCSASASSTSSWCTARRPAARRRSSRSDGSCTRCFRTTRELGTSGRILEIVRACRRTPSPARRGAPGGGRLDGRRVRATCRARDASRSACSASCAATERQDGRVGIEHVRAEVVLHELSELAWAIRASRAASSSASSNTTRSTNATYVATLRAYLDCFGDVPRAAERISVHPEHVPLPDAAARRAIRARSRRPGRAAGARAAAPAARAGRRSATRRGTARLDGRREAVQHVGDRRDAEPGPGRHGEAARRRARTAR